MSDRSSKTAFTLLVLTVVSARLSVFDGSMPKRPALGEVKMDVPITALTRDDLSRLAIKESSNGFLLPAAARYNLTVIIDFPWLPGDLLTITWAGTPGSGSYTSPRIPIGGFKPPFTTHINNILVAFNLGRTVIVSYTLYRGTEPPVVSQPLPLFIPLINQLDLPLPVIKEANDEGGALTWM